MAKIAALASLPAPGAAGQGENWIWWLQPDLGLLHSSHAIAHQRQAKAAQRRQPCQRQQRQVAQGQQ
jgi:uncharacterized membrane protein YccC